MKQKHLLLVVFFVTLFSKFGYTQHISEGGGFSTSICNDGSVMAWGSNYTGQLGNNSTGDDEYLPVNTFELYDVKNIYSGNTTTVALKNDGTVWAWGNNTNGGCGDNSLVSRFAPVQVVGTDGIGFLNDIIDIAVGEQTGYVVRSDGTVWAWGASIKGSLGNNETGFNQLTPIQIHGLNNIGFLEDVIQIEADTYSAYALKSDGTVWSWGDNYYENLGDGTDTDRLTPVQVVGLTDIVNITSGTGCAFAVTSDGTVWGWGGNDYGKLGNGTLTPRFPLPEQVVGIDNAVAVAAGQHFTMILRSDGTVWTCGNNSDGQLGDGTVENKSICIPATGVSNISEIAAGARTAMVMDNDGNIFTWGDNYTGQLGDGTTTDRWTIGAVEDLCAGLVGIFEENENINSLNIYPNPTNSDFYISTEFSTDNTIEIFNSNGLLIKSIIVNNIVNKININELPAGIYFIHHVEGNSNGKIVVY